MAVPNMIVTLVANTTKFASGMKNAGGILSKFGGGIKGIGFLAAGAFAALGIGILKLIPEFINLGIQAKIADERLKFMAYNMKGVSKQTDLAIQNMKDFATATQQSTGIDDEFIKGIQGKLLAFKDLAKSAGVTGGLFERVTQLTLDMSVVFGDAETNAVKLAKIMKDPIANMNVLNRSSGGFTNTQKAQAIAIEATSGKIAAQDYLLGILEDTFRGLAEKTADPMARINKQFEDIAQAIAIEVLPAIELLADTIVAWVNSPGGKKAIQDMTDAMSDFIGWITSPDGQKQMDEWIQKFITVAGFIAEIIQGLATIIALFGDMNKRAADYNRAAMNDGINSRFAFPPVTPPRNGGNNRPGTGPFGGTSRGLVVNFNAPIDSVSAGREISRVLKDYERSNGNRR